MSTVEFTDNSIKVKTALNDAAISFLYGACGEIERQTKQNTAVGKINSGAHTKDSWKYAVDEDKLEGYVGSTAENAIWEEFGTGEHALNRDGRKGGWWIKVGYGSNEISPQAANAYKWKKVKRDKNGNLTYVFTRGKKPKRPLFKAYTALKSQLQRMAQEMFKEL